MELRGEKDKDTLSPDMPEERLVTWTILAFHSHYLTLTVIRFTAHRHTHVSLMNTCTRSLEGKQTFHIPASTHKMETGK